MLWFAFFSTYVHLQSKMHTLQIHRSRLYMGNGQTSLVLGQFNIHVIRFDLA